MKLAEYQIQRDDAQKHLMDLENGQLRQRLFNREQKKADVRITSEARHLTEEKVLIEKGLANWRAKMKLINLSLKPRFKIEREKIDAVLKEQVSMEKQVEDERKRAVQMLKQQRLEAEKGAEKEAGKWRREMAALAKGMQDVADKDTKREKKRLATLEKAVLQKPIASRKKKAAAAVSSSDDDDSFGSSASSHFPSPVEQKKRPQPRPLKRTAAQDLAVADLEPGDVVSTDSESDGDEQRDGGDLTMSSLPIPQPTPDPAGPSNEAAPAPQIPLPAPRYPLQNRR